MGRPRKREGDWRSFSMQLPTPLLDASDRLAYERGMTRTDIFERILSGDKELQRDLEHILAHNKALAQVAS